MKQHLPFSHSNNKFHNWLVYEINYMFLNKFSKKFKGHLYDLGCGEMPYREWLLNYADSYTGVDWSNTLHNFKADIAANLNEPLPIESEQADTVVSFSVMEHLREPQLFLNESYRILKHGGRMILQVPFMWWVHEEPCDYFRYTRYGLKYMFEKAGFADIEVYPTSGFWTVWILKFNYQSTRLIRGPWPVRNFMAIIMRLIWAVDQRVAPWLDNYWKCEQETGGYFVVAQKI
ncbi:Methyltransferase domain-containing protein [Candidatus Electronema halotolerans]